MIWTHLRSCYGFDMRLFVGGKEEIFPARWFFCDPGAKWFPSPHGAEASPWLKDWEVNEWWGEIKGKKLLDKGINPGYPGLCFVGDPQWFVDGELPVNFDHCLTPVVPDCCGHLPPENLDPRCPPVVKALNNPFNPGTIVYDHYIMRVTGAEYPADFLNGKHIMKLVQQDPFFWLWEAVGENDIFIFLDPDLFHFYSNELPPIGSGNFIGWYIPLDLDCATTPRVMSVSFDVGVPEPGIATVDI